MGRGGERQLTRGKCHVALTPAYQFRPRHSPLIPTCATVPRRWRPFHWSQVISTERLGRRFAKEIGSHLLQSQQRVKGGLVAEYFVSLEVEDLGGWTYSQVPDLIGYRSFLRYLLGAYVSTLDRALPEFLSLTDCAGPGRNPVCPPEFEPPWKEIDMSFLLVGERDLEEGRRFCGRWMCRGHEALVCPALVPAPDSALPHRFAVRADMNFRNQ